MAGDWIKVRSDLRDDPAVFKIAGQMQLDRFAVVGRLIVFWAWVDAHAVDGFVDGATSTVVDDVTSTTGFADALVAAKWLRVDAAGVYIPKHDRHNTESAKERNLKSERQARWRAKQAAKKVENNVDGHVDATPSTREEKRREEENPTGSTPSDKPTSKAKGSRTAKGTKRVPETFAVSPDLMAWAGEHTPLIDIRRETEKFKDWEFQHARTDWPATWRTWMRKAQETAESKGGVRTGQETFV